MNSNVGRGFYLSLTMETYEMSNKFALLPGEQVVKSSEDDVLVLTNKRIRYSSVLNPQVQ